MMKTDNFEEIIIYYGKRDNQFKTLINNILKKSKLKSHYIDILLSEESLKEYNNAFTSASANEKENYEVYEQLGDLSVNKFIVSYMYKKFPVLMSSSEYVKIVARLRIVYGSKQTFFTIADKLGFWDFVSASEEQRSSEKKKLLEDSFEAFIGVTEYLLDTKIRNGIGYAIVYNILENIFDGLNISLKYEHLYDAKTRLKELFDYFNKLREKDFGTLLYEETKDTEAKLTTSYVYKVNLSSKKELIGEGTASIKPDAQQRAAQNAINNLYHMGIRKPIPQIYLNLLK